MKRFICAFGILVAMATIAFAHPHMSLECRLRFEYTGEKCVGFEQEWTFDPFFSASIIQEKDDNRDGKFSPSEIEGVRNYAFVNLRKYGYFTYIRSGDKRVTPPVVERFSASIRGDRLVYHFFVPLRDSSYGKDFSVAIFDSTYYCAISYPDDAANIHQREVGGVEPKWERVVNKKYPVYYNPMGSASDTTIYMDWKPGLETAYPEEIRVRLVP